MIIRGLTINDIPKLKEIHAKHFYQEFTLDEFLDTHLIQGFAAVNDTNEIICAGGVRTIAEAVLITDKDFSVRERREALYKILQASVLLCGRLEYKEVHAFIQDRTWEHHLTKVGFHQTKGQALVLGLGD